MDTITITFQKTGERMNLEKDLAAILGLSDQQVIVDGQVMFCIAQAWFAVNRLRIINKIASEA